MMCLLLQLGQIDVFDTEEDVPWYLKTKHDTDYNISYSFDASYSQHTARDALCKSCKGM